MTDPDEKPSFRDIGRWSFSIAGYWKFLAAELGLPLEKVDNISKSLQQYPTLKDQALQMLQEWLEIGNATYRKMAEALRTLDKGELADTICRPQEDSLEKAQHQRKHSPPATPAANLGEASKEMKKSGPSCSPQNVKAHSNGLTSIWVEWDEVPEGEQNGVIQKYEVILKDSKLGNQKREAVSAPTKHLNLTELESFQKYDISVVAYANDVAGPASPVETVMTGKQEFCQLRRQLAKFYEENMSRVQVAPWDPDDTVPVDNVYTRLSWSREKRDHKGTEQEELGDYTDIFSLDDSNGTAKRIVVSGQGGIGKSTFTQKLAVDWARGKKEALKKFDVLLVIKLRDVRGDVRELKDIILHSGVLPLNNPTQVDHLVDYIEKNEERVLMLLDGFDEYDEAKDLQSGVNRIIRAQMFRNCHVVTTTRLERVDEIRKYMQAQCKINGFTREDIVEFATKYVGEDQCNTFMRYLKENDLLDMASIPLMLLFLCLLWKERADQPLPGSRTDLYQQIVQCIIDHCEAKRSPGSQTDLEIYDETLSKIGKVAFHALLRNSLVFDTKELPEDVLKEDVVRLGFLSMSKVQHQRFKSIASFFHKSIQEYLAAWYIAKGAPDIRWTSHIKDFNTIKKLLPSIEFAFDLGLQADQADAVLLHLKEIREKERNLVPNADEVTCDDYFRDDQRIFQKLCYRLLLVSGCKETSVETYLDAVGGVVLLNGKKHEISGICVRSLDRVLPITLRHDKFVLLVFGMPRADDSRRKLMQVLDEADVRAITWASGQSHKYVKASVLLKFKCSLVFDELVDALDEVEDYADFYDMDPLEYASEMVVLKRGAARYLCYASCATLIHFTPEFLQLFQPPPSDESPLSGSERPSECQERNPRRNSSAPENDLPIHVTSLVCAIFSSLDCFRQCVTRQMMLEVPPPANLPLPRHFTPIGTGVSTVAGHLQHIPELHALSNTQMTAKEAADLSVALVHVPDLVCLSLCDNPLGTGVSNVAVNLQHVPALNFLDLSYTQMTAKEAADLSVALVHVPNLEKLYLSGNPLGTGVSNVAVNLQHVPNLELLHLSNTQMTAKEAADLSVALVHVPNLKTLCLSGNPLGPGLSNFVFSRTPFYKFNHLNLSNTQMTEKEAADLSVKELQNVPELITHDFSVNPLGPGVRSVAANLAALPELRYLNLSNTQMTEKEAADLSVKVLQNVPELITLDFSVNPLGPGVSSVAANLEALPELRYLNLSNTRMTEKEAADLSLALVRVPDLWNLDLSGNPIGPGVSAVAAYLQHVPNLGVLNLSSTQMTEKEAADLSTALVRVPELQGLYLSGNPRVGRGVISLAEQIVAHVPELEELDLTNTGMDDECRTALEKAKQDRRAPRGWEFNIRY